MLKLPKGLKKKKKGKKSKKDQELFTEEELEQYKREHQAHPESSSSSATAAVAVAEEQHQQAQSDNNKATAGDNDEEWSKFAALTSDIDSILKKTQGNLDRIKSTSFFQRVQSPSQKKVEEEQKRAEEAAAEEARKREEEARREAEEKDPARQLLNAVVELSESEEDSDVDDSAFDTTFTDRVEAGELPLAYVAEEDEEELDLGPDPFDTGYAEKVIKGPEVSARGKKLINIGAAVEVLTGKVEIPVAAATKSRRQRRGIQNLLLESFEVEQEGGDESLQPSQGVDNTPKTLLDEPAELADDIPIDLSVSLHLALLQKQQQPKESEHNDEEKDSDEFEKVDAIELPPISFTLRKRVEDNQEEDKSKEADIDWSEFELARGEWVLWKFIFLHKLIFFIIVIFLHFCTCHIIKKFSFKMIQILLTIFF